jgi:hypothetical protein
MRETPSGNQTLSSTVRVPGELYEALRQIRLSLESQYQSAAPTVQDMVSIALKRFINDWENSDKKTQLLDELLEHRKLARSNMGKRRIDDS